MVWARPDGGRRSVHTSNRPLKGDTQNIRSHGSCDRTEGPADILGVPFMFLVTRGSSWHAAVSPETGQVYIWKIGH